MTYHSFSQALKQPPSLKVKLKDIGAGHADCELKLFSWGKGTIIKIEGVNVNTDNDDKKEDLQLVFKNVSEYVCNPCKNGYLFNIFFSDISVDAFLNSDAEVYLKRGEKISAVNISSISSKN